MKVNGYEINANANLYGADLIDAILIDAFLINADLSGANLRGADLRGANLSNAYLSFTSIAVFSYKKHFAFHHEGYIKIGCIGNSIEWWLENYQQVGVDKEYSKVEIKAYGAWIKLISELT